MVTELCAWLTEDGNVEMIVKALIDMTNQLTMAVGDLIVVLLPAIVKIIGAICKQLVQPDTVMSIINATLYIIGAVCMALIKAIPELLKALGEIFMTIGKGIADFLGDVIGKLKTWFTNVVSNVKQLGSNIISSLKNLPSQALQAGKDLIQGLINGVKNMAGKAVSAVKDVGRSLVNGIKNVLKIGSPSKVFKQIGAWTAEGFGIGYESTMDDVQADMVDSMDGLTGNMTATVQAYGSSDPLAGSEVNNYNGGNISINVYGAEGQSVDELADKIAYKLEDLTRRKGAVYA